MGKKSRKIHDVQVPTAQRSTRRKTRHMTMIQRRNRKEEASGAVKMAEIPKLVRSNGNELIPDPGQRSQWMHLSVEENLLTLLEHSAQADREELLEDKMMFVEVTYSLCVTPNLAQVPTPKMLQAVLGFIQECFSVGLTVSSYNLLVDLERRHPRVAVRESTSSDSGGKFELIIEDKVWSPLDETCSKPFASSPTGVSSNIFILLEAIARRITETSSAKKATHEGGDESNKDAVIVSQYWMLRYLLTLLQTDLECRFKVSDSDAEEGHSVVLGSYLCKLISSLSQPEKESFMTNLASIISPCAAENDGSRFEEGRRLRRVCSKRVQHNRDERKVQDGVGETSESVEKSHEGRKAIPLPATGEFGRLAASLLVWVMKVDHLHQEYVAIAEGPSRRGDRLLVDTLLNLCKKASTLDAYLKAVSEPRDKLKFVKDYFLNFAPRPVVEELGDFTLLEFLEKWLSHVSDKKALNPVCPVFKEADSLPLLLSHAFQAYLLLHGSVDSAGDEQIKKDFLENRVKICKSVIVSMNNVWELEGHNMLLPTVKQTVFVAKRISGPDMVHSECSKKLSF